MNAMTCKHPYTKLFTRDGADHTGLDLFARCPDCGFEGPYIECNPSEITPELRRKVRDAFDDDAKRGAS
jgi:hypothetical protein